MKVGDPGSRTIALLQPRSGQIGLRFFSLVRTLFVRSTALPAALQHQAHSSHRDLDGVAAHQLCCYRCPHQLVPLGVRRETTSGRLAGQKQLPADAQLAARDSGQCTCSTMAQAMSALLKTQSGGSDTTTSRFAHACTDMLFERQLTVSGIRVYTQVEKAADIANADRLVFPGVGAYGQAMERLKQLGYTEALKDYIQVTPGDKTTCSPSLLTSESVRIRHGQSLTMLHAVRQTIPGHMYWHASTV